MALLCLVAAFGYPIGKIKIAGVSLGASAVLLVGLLVGALDPRFILPDLIMQFGLALFIYTLGLSSARSIKTSFSGKGLQTTLATIGLLVFFAIVVHVVGRFYGFSAELTAGLFAGTLTAAPSAAAASEVLIRSGLPLETSSIPIVGYSLAYPFGIITPMLVMVLSKKFYRVDYEQEKTANPEFKKALEPIFSQTVRVTQEKYAGKTILELKSLLAKDVMYGRVKSAESLVLAQANTKLELGDEVVIVGRTSLVMEVTEALGEVADDDISLDRHVFDYRRIFVSNPNVANIPLKELALPNKENTIITRVKRGDQEFVPTGNSELELGDRVRVLARRDELDKMTKFFGDSYRSLSELDLFHLVIGLALGALLGLIQIPLGNGLTLSLGFAGGPLVVSLIVGNLGRTGPIIWQIPYSANLTLRQFGLMLFMTAVGLRGGYQFWQTLQTSTGWMAFGLVGILTLSFGIISIVVYHKLLKIPLISTLGVYAGLNTQPVHVGFANEQTNSDLPNRAYASVSAFATITKMVLAQIMVLWK